MLSAFSAVSSLVSTCLDHLVPVLKNLGLRNLGCLHGLVLEAVAFSRNFVTAVTPVEPLTFNVCQCSMSIGVVKAIGGGVQGSLRERAIQGRFHISSTLSVNTSCHSADFVYPYKCQILVGSEPC